jgi:hypothetical protein
MFNHGRSMKKVCELPFASFTHASIFALGFTRAARAGGNVSRNVIFEAKAAGFIRPADRRLSPLFRFARHPNKRAALSRTSQLKDQRLPSSRDTAFKHK